MRPSRLVLPVFALAAALVPAFAPAHAQSAAPAAALVPGRAPAPTPAADSAAIRRAALDYIEGWYTADAARMAGALHPDLAKRAVDTDRQGHHWLYSSGADGLIRATRLGQGTDVPPGRRWTQVQILDVDGGLASVKLSSTKLIDYMHLARWDGSWKIVNVLWDVRPEDRPRPRPAP